MSPGVAMSPEVWVWVPRDQQGAPQPVLSELLQEGRGLARRLGGGVTALSDRELEPATLELLGRWGVGRVRMLGSPLAPHPEPRLEQQGGFPLAALAAQGTPRVLLFAANTLGRIMAPLWAAHTGAALVTGATGITSDGRDFVVARPSHRERFETLVRVSRERPLVVTLLPGSVGAVAPPGPDTGATPRLIAGPVSAGVLAPTRVLPPDPATLALDEAERIVAFGRGAFSEEAVRLVEELARVLGAVVAGSRPAADEGWLPFSRQIGLTGAIVRPKLYVAVGISGAPYHMVGVKEPETLVAINADPEAPIFAGAHLGIVGDLHQVLPHLIQHIEAGTGPIQAQPGAGPTIVQGGKKGAGDG